jgi:hypothetical protein
MIASGLSGSSTTHEYVAMNRRPTKIAQKRIPFQCPALFENWESLMVHLSIKRGVELNAVSLTSGHVD